MSQGSSYDNHLKKWSTFEDDHIIRPTLVYSGLVSSPSKVHIHYPIGLIYQRLRISSLSLDLSPSHALPLPSCSHTLPLRHAITPHPSPPISASSGPPLSWWHHTLPLLLKWGSRHVAHTRALSTAVECMGPFQRRVGYGGGAPVGTCFPLVVHPSPPLSPMVVPPLASTSRSNVLHHLHL